MSEIQHGEEHRPRAEEDVVPAGRLIAIGIGALVIFFIGSVAMTLVLGAKRAALLPEGPPPIPAEAGKPKIGMLEQVLFENQTRAAQLKRAKLEQLDGYGWVDRRAGIIHIPIAEAMDRVAKGERP